MRLKIILVVVILGGLVAWYVISGTNKFSTIDEEAISFAIDNPDEVTKIYIVQKNAEKPCLLEKTGNGWTVNGKYKAWQKKVDFLLNETMTRVRVKGPAPKAARTNVISKMSVTGIKVEIYTDDPDQPSSAYYVGQPTSNLQGTYFWKEGAKTPYVAHIPGTNRYLTPAYIYKEEDWISRTIFEEEASNIRRIAVNYPGKVKNSFEITQNDTTLEISTDPGNPDDLNISAIRSFINHFEKLNFEGFASVYKDSLVNAILNTSPFVTVVLENKAGETITMDAFTLPSYEGMHGLYDKDGNMLHYDPNRFLARASNIDRPVVIQDYTFRKVFVTYSDFLLSTAQTAKE